MYPVATAPRVATVARHRAVAATRRSLITSLLDNIRKPMVPPFWVLENGDIFHNFD